MIFSLFFLSIVYTQQVKELPKDDSCISCHMDEENMPEDFNKWDIHLQKGLSCAGCHGGNPNINDEDAMAESEGFIGVPDKKDIPQFCGKCHSDIKMMRTYQPRIQTDQVSQYFTSVHGQKLKKGDKKVADCTSCHTSHSILPAKDPRSSVYAINVPETCKKCHSDKEYMKEYKIRTDQYSEFVVSVHGKALLEKKDTGAPACNDCHGNHGATPPGLTSISHVCGTCHYNNMEYFSATVMSAKFEEQKIHGCEECHGNHNVMKTNIEMVGTDDKAVCVKCHKSGDEGYETAKAIRKSLVNLSQDLDSLAMEQKEVERIGMDDMDINYLYQEAHQSFIKAQTLVHTFDSTKVEAETYKGIKKSKEASLIAVNQIKEHKTRRLGLGITTIFITLLVIALYFKIKEIDKSEKKA